jgi:hypothetical protein
MVVLEIPIPLDRGQVTRIVLAKETVFLGCDFRVGGKLVKLATPGDDGPKFYLRALFDEDEPRETPYYFVAIGSGQKFSAVDGMSYVGTGAIIVGPEQTLVVHLFQLLAVEVEKATAEALHVVH